jgi:bis(5'-nucleosyl)-tetraphosphatase (symmetrical)
MTSPTASPRPLAIGDLQGCNARLGALLHRADPDNSRPLWFAGDLVNRGPHSLAALRRLRALGDRATVVLGNHDLHLLASVAGVRKTHRSDTLDDIMLADDRTALLDWVRTRPLAHLADGHLMVHAGVFPQWSPEETVALAAEVQAVLSGPHWIDFLRVMYGNTPSRWSSSLSGDDRLRTIVNGLTRMRFIDAEGGMDFEVKEGADDAPPGLTPWFDVPGRRTANVTVIFGHWSTLGLLMRPNLLGLDTGCVWGGSLTAVSLPDRELFQVKCHRARDPAAH